MSMMGKVDVRYFVIQVLYKELKKGLIFLYMLYKRYLVFTFSLISRSPLTSP